MEEEMVNNMLLKPKNTIELNKDAKYYSKLDNDYFYNPETFLNNVNNPLMNPFHSFHGDTYGTFPKGYVKKDNYNNGLVLHNSTIINEINKKQNDLLQSINDEEKLFNDFYRKYLLLMNQSSFSNKYLVNSNKKELLIDLNNAIKNNSKLTLFRKYNVSSIEELKNKKFDKITNSNEPHALNYNQKGGNYFITQYEEFNILKDEIKNKYSFNKFIKKKDSNLNYDKMIENVYEKYMSLLVGINS
jgi:hypothetical protein